MEWFKALMTKQVINEIITHSHPLAAMNALMSSIFLVRSRMTDEIRKLWIRFRTQLALHFCVLADLLAMIFHMLDMKKKN